MPKKPEILPSAITGNLCFLSTPRNPATLNFSVAPTGALVPDCCTGALGAFGAMKCWTGAIYFITAANTQSRSHCGPLSFNSTIPNCEIMKSVSFLMKQYYSKISNREIVCREQDLLLSDFEDRMIWMMQHLALSSLVHFMILVSVGNKELKR